jgi:DNA polymerase epsilon subunit 1
MLETTIDIREYDIKYLHRCAIDFNINVRKWFPSPFNQNVLQKRLLSLECSRYSVRACGTGACKVVPRPDILVWAERCIIAFDIETCEAPLKYPDAEVDQVRTPSCAAKDAKIIVIHLILYMLHCIFETIIHYSL